MGYLKRANVRIESIDQTIEIQQPHAKAQAEAIAAYKTEGKSWMGGFVTIHYCVPEWSQHSPEELATMFTLAQMNEVVEKINDLSGADEKNSESIPNVSSISS